MNIQKTAKGLPSFILGGNFLVTPFTNRSSNWHTPYKIGEKGSYVFQSVLLFPISICHGYILLLENHSLMHNKQH